MKNITAEQILQQSLYHFCWSQTETTCTNSLVLVNHESQNRQFQMDMFGRVP